MQQTIYFGKKKLLLSTEALPDEYPTNVAVFGGAEPASVQAAVSALQNDQTQIAMLVHTDLHALLEELKKEFQFIQAAGGLVLSDKHMLLLIFRKGKWDLPKGKLDEGEDLATCAIREVEEETGLTNISITSPLLVTYHTYYQNGQHCLKESHWYLMQAPQMDNLTPQTEEDIEECIWIKPENIQPYFENMQHSVVDVLNEALPQLA